MYTEQGGFTILETMIVMVVSSAMLVTMITMFSGQQRSTQFSQGLREIEIALQDVINDAETGYFPDIAGGTKCEEGAGYNSGPKIETDVAGTREQGTNSGCVFLGKTIHMQKEKMTIYPVVGNASLTNAALASALPVVAVDLAEDRVNLWGLELYAVYLGNAVSSTHDSSALLTIASSPNGTGFSNIDNLNSGTQRINSYVSMPSPSLSSVNINDVDITADELSYSLQNIGANSWPSDADGAVVVYCYQDDPAGSVGRRFGGIVVAGGKQGIGTRIQIEGDGHKCE